MLIVTLRSQEILGTGLGQNYAQVDCGNGKIKLLQPCMVPEIEGGSLLLWGTDKGLTGVKCHFVGRKERERTGFQ